MTEPEAQLTIREGQGYLTGVEPDVLEAIKAATRFRPAGFQFSPAFNTWVGSGAKRKRKWDGWVRLYRHSKFPAGLLGTIEDVLKSHDVEYDLTKDDPIELPSIDFRLEGIEDRDYQDDAVEAALLNPRGIIQAPTGAGKTAIGARIVAARGKRALIIVPTIDLLLQYREFLSKHLWWGDDDFVKVGQLGNGVVDPQEVTVATVRTIAKACSVAYESYEYGEYDDKDDTEVNPKQLREWVDGIGTVIVDEAHILGAQVIYDVVTKLQAPNKYGMSASPWRDDGADLMIEAATGKKIYRISTDKLVADGWLVPPIIKVIPTDGLWRPAAWQKNQFAKAYSEEIVENPLRNMRIAQDVEGCEGATLVLVKLVKHGRILEQVIPGSRFLHGQDPGLIRQQAFEDMRAGRLRVVIATTIADMGLDLPICQNLVLAGGGKSSTRHLQRIGRAVRPYPGKTHATVIDYDDGHVHDWFRNHAKARRKIEKAEWANCAIWI